MLFLGVLRTLWSPGRGEYKRKDLRVQLPDVGSWSEIPEPLHPCPCSCPLFCFPLFPPVPCQHCTTKQSDTSETILLKISSLSCGAGSELDEVCDLDKHHSISGSYLEAKVREEFSPFGGNPDWWNHGSEVFWQTTVCSICPVCFAKETHWKDRTLKEVLREFICLDFWLAWIFILLLPSAIGALKGHSAKQSIFLV